MTTTTLTPEIWKRVIQRAAETSPEDRVDHSELWMNHRFVNRTFKTAIEDLFQDRYIRKIFIRYNFGPFKHPNGTESILILEYEFDNLTIEDGNKAVFSTDPGDEDSLEEIRIRQADAIAEDDHSVSVLLPKHTIHLGRVLFDSPLPGLETNNDDWTIKFDWKEMFTRFYGEERHYNRLVAEFAGRQQEFGEELKGRMQRGEINLMQVMSKASTVVADWSLKSYKAARRARISRSFKELGEEWDWENLDEDRMKEEKEALEALTTKREYATSSMEDSDDGGDKEMTDDN